MARPAKPETPSARVALTLAQRQGAIAAAPREHGDHPIRVDGGPVAIVRVDHLGRRIVALARDAARALQLAALPRDPRAMVEHDLRIWGVVADVARARAATRKYKSAGEVQTEAELADAP